MIWDSWIYDLRQLDIWSETAGYMTWDSWIYDLRQLDIWFETTGYSIWDNWIYGLRQLDIWVETDGHRIWDSWIWDLRQLDTRFETTEYISSVSDVWSNRTNFTNQKVWHSQRWKMTKPKINASHSHIKIETNGYTWDSQIYLSQKGYHFDTLRHLETALRRCWDRATVSKASQSRLDIALTVSKIQRFVKEKCSWSGLNFWRKSRLSLLWTCLL